MGSTPSVLPNQAVRNVQVAPSPSQWRALWQDLMPYGWAMSGAFLLLLATNLGNLWLPMALRQLIDLFQLPSQVAQTAAINQQALLLIALFSGQAICSYAQSYLFSSVAERFVFDLQMRLYRHMQDLPLSFYVRQRTGEISSRFASDMQQLRDGLTTHFAGLLRHVPMVLAAASLMLYLNWRLTLLALLSVALLIGVAVLALKQVRRASIDAQAKLALAIGVLDESLSGIAVVKAFVRELYEMQRVEQALSSACQANLRRERTRLLLLPLSNVVGFSALIAVVWYGAQQVSTGAITAGALVAYLAYAAILAASLAQISNHLGGIQQSLGAVDAIYALLRQPVPQTHSATGHQVAAFQGRVEFVNVTFGYEGMLKPVLRNFSLTIAPGEVVALVGASGAGKSTLANLLLNFYTPQSGRILIDDYVLSEIDPAELRKQIGVVLQDTMLFSGSVRENIRYGRLDATDAEVEQAAESAYAHDFIRELPHGYETEVGQRGSALSFGQRQRICIARVLLKQPQLLILDEATAALDSTNERLVQAAIDRLMVGRTTLIIAHRLAAIQHADRIIVLDQTGVAEVGSHSELIKHNGIYHQLYQQQQLNAPPSPA